MKLAVFAPHGALGTATGLIHLFANYLRPLFQESIELRCNGFVSACDRDAARGRPRELDDCSRCMHEQSQLAEWAGLSLRDLSPFLTPDEVSLSRRWAALQRDEELRSSTLAGARPFDIALTTISRRPKQEQGSPEVLRNHLVSSLQLQAAALRFLKQNRPDLTLVGSSDDMHARAFLTQARALGARVATFSWDPATRVVSVRHPARDERALCELVVDDVTTLRADLKTWPKEVLKHLEQLSLFLDISPDQLALPIAR